MVPVRSRSVLARQAEAAALGGRDDMQGRVPLRLSERHGKPFLGGGIDDVRVRAYYPPTRELWTVTDYIKSMSWSDAVDQAAVTATIELDSSGGQIGAYLNRPGIVVFIEFKAEDGKRFRERLRLVVWDTTISDVQTGTLTWTCFDHLLYLQMAKGSFKYSKDKTHRQGWTAAEIIQDICRRYRIPIATRMAKQRPRRRRGRKKGHTTGSRVNYRIVKTAYRFTFNATNITLYEAIAQVLTIDSRKTGKHYFIEADKGRLVVRRRRQVSSVLALAEDYNLRGANFGRTMTEVFTSFSPSGTDRGAKGKPSARAGITAARKRPKPVKARPGPKERKRQADTRRRRRAAVARQRSARLRGEPGNVIAGNEEKELAASMLFGAMKYTPYNKKLSVNDPDWSRKAAQETVDRLSRASKSLVLTADGNSLLRQGDRIYVAVAFSRTAKGTPRLMRREVYVSAVTHNLVPGDYSMEVQCAWREKEVAVKQQQDEGSKDGADTEKGRFSKEDLVALASEAGFPDPNTAAAVAMAESQGNPRAIGDKSLAALGSRGLWQIFTKAHPQYDPERLLEPRYNATAAYEVFKAAGESFSPWTMFRNGRYKQYL